MRILLYGLGQGLNLVEKKIRKEHEIIGYMDSCSELYLFRGRPFYQLEVVREVPFDYVVITIQEQKTAWKVYRMLIDTFQLSSRQVIPFYAYANYELYDIKMRTYDLDKLHGLIFGNSHAECGFLEEELAVPFLNLSVSAQDIYYNYKTFHTCISSYGKRLKNLEYVLIDLYDYCYFNFDTSKTIYAIDYICRGGYLDEHNFERNHNFQKSFREELFDRAYLWDRPSSLYEIFENIDVKQQDLPPASRWGHIDKKNRYITAGPIIGGVASKRSEDTVKENINLLGKFLKEVQDFSANTKIIFTLIPRYIEMERATEGAMKLWKKEFLDIINGFCYKYNAELWNYKNHQEISKNHTFYYDVEHLNTVGARALTAILYQDLQRITEKNKSCLQVKRSERA